MSAGIHRVEGPSLLVWILAACLSLILVVIHLLAGEPPWFWVFLPLTLEAAIWLFMIAFGILAVMMTNLRHPRS